MSRSRLRQRVDSAVQVVKYDPPEDQYDIDPWDADTYKEIYDFARGLKGADSDDARDSEEDEYAEGEVLLRQDFARGKVRFTGTWKRDCWAFVKCNHPLVALFASHPLHPVARWEHWVIHIFAFLFGLVLSGITNEATPCVMCDVQCGHFASDCYFDHSYRRGTSATLGVLAGNVSNSESDERLRKISLGLHRLPGTDLVRSAPDGHYCCLTESVGANWFVKTFAIETNFFEFNLGATLYTMLLVIAYMIIYHQLMMCNCFQDKGALKRHMAECTGHIIVLLLNTTFLVLCWPPTIWYLATNQMVLCLIVTLITSKLGGWIFVLLIKVLLFSWQFHSQAESSSKFHVTDEHYLAYVNDQLSQDHES